MVEQVTPHRSRNGSVLLQLTLGKPRGVSPARLLGPWCVAGEPAAEGPPVLDGYTRFDVAAAEAELDAAYEAVLERLAATLDAFHGVSRGREYWELMTYRFLAPFVSELYLRWRYLANVLADDAELCPVVMDPADFTVPAHDYDLIWGTYDSDRFNLQLFSQLVLGMGIPSLVLRADSFPPDAETPPIPGAPRPVGWKQRLRAALRRPAPATGARQVVTFPRHLPAETQAALERSAGVRISPMRSPEPAFARAPMDHAARARLQAPAGADEFTRLAVEALRVALPRDYLEDFPHYLRVARRLARRGSPALVVASYMSSVTARAWLGECRALRGAPRIAVVQHGGNYGEASSLSARWTDPERRVADAFGSWGWGGDEPGVVPLTAPQLMETGPRGGAGEGILIVSGKVWAYPGVAGFVGVPPLGETQADFFGRLDPSLRAVTTFRAHPRDVQALLERGRWDRHFPEVIIDRGERKVAELIPEARAVVINYLFSSTLAECLVMDRPVLVLSCGREALVHPRARPYYDRLMEVGVVHRTPESAADVLNASYADMQAWWREPERRAAVDAYRERFARAAADPVEEWTRFLRGQVPAAVEGGR
jgi:putative transferase (TIGR04331 family)